MTEVDETGGQPAQEGDESVGSSVLDVIRQRNEEIRKDKHLTLMVPGYKGCARIRYQLKGEKEMDRIGKRLEDAADADSYGAKLDLEADMLLALADQVELRESAQSEWEVLRDDNGPVRLEGRLAALLGWESIKRSREVVLEMFCPLTDPSDPDSPRSHPNAMEQHTTAIMAWYRGEVDAISRRLLGE